MTADRKPVAPAGRPPRLKRIKASLDRIEKVLAEHPEIRYRTARFLTGELPAMEVEDMDKPVQVSIRLPEALLKKATNMVERLAASDQGVLLGKVNRSDVIRVATMKGLELLDRELPQSKTAARAGKKKRPPPKRTK